MTLENEQRGEENAARAADEDGAGDRAKLARREVLVKYAKWTPPAMMSLLLSDRASAQSAPQAQPSSPTAPGGFPTGG